ncbi:MAG: SIR2 family protein [Janthinobacterium lividum]
MTADIAIEDRVVQLGSGLAAIPERLLLAHARGEVLFICGAGISRPAGLPDFRQLVIEVYAKLDASTHSVLLKLPQGACNQWQLNCASLTNQQTAEVKRFTFGDYDVVLGMLERRLDDKTRGDSQVRRVVAAILRSGAARPAAIHKALMALADRGGATTIVTTNFDLLLQNAAQRLRSPIETYSLGSIPRPSRSSDFAGVLHIHGALDKTPERTSDFVLSDQDFGEFYMRRRVVPDFIYDAARLYHLVLVGYSANDPPMRYLLNAVAADGKRFDDLKERFTFYGTNSPDSVALADWNGRGITPIHYDSTNSHDALKATLERWAALSAVNGKKEIVDAALRRIVKKSRSAVTDSDRDLFDHLFRRSNASERVRLSALVSGAKAEIEWLDSIVKVCNEGERGRKT